MLFPVLRVFVPFRCPVVLQFSAGISLICGWICIFHTPTKCFNVSCVSGFVPSLGFYFDFRVFELLSTDLLPRTDRGN